MAYALLGYSGFGALGAIVAGEAPSCVGDIEKRYSDGDVAWDECCPTETWSVSTYRGVKGPENWRRRAESQIKQAMAAAFAPTTTGETALERRAYELSRGYEVTLAPRFLDRLRQAAARFDLVAPGSRWRPARALGPEHACMPEDGWEVWVSDADVPYDAARVQALLGAVGRTIPQLDTAMAAQHRFYAYDRHVPVASDEYAAWQARAIAAVESVPIAGSTVIGQIHLPLKSLAAVVPGGTVMGPTLWFRDFLDAFAPDPTMRLPGVPIRPPGPTFHGPAIPLPRPGGSSSAPGAGGTSSTSGLAVAAVAGLALYGAYRWMRAR